MSIRPTDDRISAYLDGELAPSQQEELEAALSEAEDVRDLIDDLRDLGNLLRETPSPDFESLRSSVLEHIQPQPQVATAPKARAKRRTWMWPSVAAVVVVGTLGLLVISGPQPDAPVTLPGRMLAEADFDVSATTMESAEPMSEPALGLAVREAGTEPLSAAVAGMTIEGTPLHETLRRLGRAPTAGDLVAYLDDQEEEPVLVELTVVDVVQAVDELHVLLRQQGVVEATPAEAATETKPRATGKHYAVYVEAPFACVENVINGMGNSTNVESMTNVNFQYGMAVGGAAPAPTLSFGVERIGGEASRAATGEARTFTAPAPDGSAPAAAPTASPQGGLSRFDDRTQDQSGLASRFRPPPVPLAQTIGSNGFLMGIPDVPRLKQRLTEQKLRRGLQTADKPRAATLSDEALNAPAEPQMEEVQKRNEQRNQLPIQSQRQMKALLILEESDE